VPASRESRVATLFAISRSRVTFVALSSSISADQKADPYVTCDIRRGTMEHSGALFYLLYRSVIIFTHTAHAAHAVRCCMYELGKGRITERRRDRERVREREGGGEEGEKGRGGRRRKRILTTRDKFGLRIVVMICKLYTDKEREGRIHNAVLVTWNSRFISILISTIRSLESMRLLIARDMESRIEVLI